MRARNSRGRTTKPNSNKPSKCLACKGVFNRSVIEALSGPDSQLSFKPPLSRENRDERPRVSPSHTPRAPSRTRRDPTPCLAQHGGGGESAPHRKCILRPELAPRRRRRRRRRVPALGRLQATGSRIHMASGVGAAPPRPAPSPALHRAGLASSPQPRGQQRRSPRGCQERGPLCTPGRNEQVRKPRHSSEAGRAKTPTQASRAAKPLHRFIMQ
ncbi:uncharacterized protein LOC118596721 [Onychomys torridus]|uniref:uncharacterized protein LOC118596721 n=1 Tax=Onychomys torridus TaxID=38674 RepID=UPI00167F8F68|nr:uncharacterized protein LOC118596721 [Onychomys torridus]